MDVIPPGRETSSVELQVLVDGLMNVVAAIDKARKLGLPVDVPHDLFLACQAVVELHGDPNDPGSGTPNQAETNDALRQVPLRKLIWQVITPGERFTVSQIADRLERLGVPTATNAISNALGYWVTRGRLVRERKGHYHYSPSEPAPSTPPERAVTDHKDKTERKEPTRNSVQIKQKKAI